jgi:hypothetical protein
MHSAHCSDATAHTNIPSHPTQSITSRNLLITHLRDVILSNATRHELICDYLQAQLQDRDEQIRLLTDELARRTVDPIDNEQTLRLPSRGVRDLTGFYSNLARANDESNTLPMRETIGHKRNRPLDTTSSTRSPSPQIRHPTTESTAHMRIPITNDSAARAYPPTANIFTRSATRAPSDATTVANDFSSSDSSSA